MHESAMAPLYFTSGHTTTRPALINSFRHVPASCMQHAQVNYQRVQNYLPRYVYLYAIEQVKYIASEVIRAWPLGHGPVLQVSSQ